MQYQHSIYEPFQSTPRVPENMKAQDHVLESLHQDEAIKQTVAEAYLDTNAQLPISFQGNEVQELYISNSVYLFSSKHGLQTLW